MPTVLPLLAALALIIAAAKLAGTIANRFGQPAVMGKLIIGLILGPSVLGLFDLDYFKAAQIEETLHIIGELGVIFLMFAAGLEVHLDDFAKAGRPAALAGVLGVIAPIGLGILASLPFGYTLTSATFIGIVLAATSVSISAQTLIEINRLRSLEGITLLGAAVVDDVLAIIVLSVFVALAADSGAANIWSIVWIIIRIAVFFAAAYFLGRWLPRLVSWGHKLPITEGALAVVIIIVLAFAWASETLGGVAAITGAFIAGVALGRSHLHRQISDGIHTLAYAFFVPVFLVNIGLSANLRALSSTDLGLTLVVCIVAVASKIIGSGLGARLGGMNWRQAVRVGVGMVSRGEVGLIVAGVGVVNGLLADNVFTVTVVMVLFTSLITPGLLRLAFVERGMKHVTTRDSDS
jgi:Kef-type K+ transport system membrane component KefB